MKADRFGGAGASENSSSEKEAHIEKDLSQLMIMLRVVFQR
jgi:hypothetical protein